MLKSRKDVPMGQFFMFVTDSDQMMAAKERPKNGDYTF